MANLTLTLSRHIPAPQQVVWAAVSDIPGSADRIEGIVGIEMLTGDTMEVGARWKETRTLFRRETTEEMEVTIFEPPLRYVVEADSCGAHFTSELRCDPDGDDATTLVMTIETIPTTFFARLMKPIAKLTMGTMRKMVEKDLDDIFRACTPGLEDETSSDEIADV
jgi:carbon monoxide dehydrogenase subunit G|tara:strand:+ start:685 stop:1179 length:495 start_codon:yes stop_codon:yes gene_type:complete